MLLVKASGITLRISGCTAPIVSPTWSGVRLANIFLFGSVGLLYQFVKYFCETTGQKLVDDPDATTGATYKRDEVDT